MEIRAGRGKDMQVVWENMVPRPWTPTGRLLQKSKSASWEVLHRALRELITAGA